MALRVAINGYGRVGRNIVRAYLEDSRRFASVKIVAINDLAQFQASAHLTEFDSTHGPLNRNLELIDDQLVIDGISIQMLNVRDPELLPWQSLDIDLVLECTGMMTDREQAGRHLEAGAKRVLVSAPGSDLDATMVYGVNHQSFRMEHRLISNASCTTNCLAPMCQVLDQQFGITEGFMSTVHAYTGDQGLVDGARSDPYRGRAAAHSIIPTRTGAAAAIGAVLPELSGRLDGMALRVPTLNVSLVDLTFTAATSVSADAVNTVMRASAQKDPFGVLAYNQKPLVSTDFNHSPYSCNFDGNHTRVNGSLVKVLAWYDNEWAFATRMLDQAMYINQVSLLEAVA